MKLESIQHMINLVQYNLNVKTPQELMLMPRFLDFCAMYGLEKEWK